jgi:hypothetical protein
MRMKWAGHVADMEEMRNAYKILVRKSEGKGLLERLSTDGIMDLMEIGCKGMWFCSLFNDAHYIASSDMMLNK